MAARNRNNPLALAVLICLSERPMHPYEVATTLRQRQKHESVRLNYGSLYAVVASLEKRGLIAPQETERAGRLPERTVYRLTDAGLIEAHDWLTDLISTPVKEYPSFEAALSFLPALPPEQRGRAAAGACPAPRTRTGPGLCLPGAGSRSTDSPGCSGWRRSSGTSCVEAELAYVRPADR